MWKRYVHMNVYVVIVIKLIKNPFIEQLFDWIWILTILIKQYIDTNKSTILRWLGGQQMSHQICLKPCHMIFLAINYYLVKKTLKYFSSKISVFLLFIYTELFILRKSKKNHDHRALLNKCFLVWMYITIYFVVF